MRQLRKRGRPATPKVFCVGANKTGTSTVAAVLASLGRKLPNQQRQEATLAPLVRRGDIEAIRRFCRRYDAFQDQPFSTPPMYALMDALFPGSKFILTLRDPDQWFDSTVSQLARIGWPTEHAVSDGMAAADAVRYLGAGYAYEVLKRQVTFLDPTSLQPEHRWDLLLDRDFRTAQFVHRNREVVAYFQDRPDSLLAIDVTQDADTSRIVEFLGLPASCVTPMPHHNARPH